MKIQYSHDADALYISLKEVAVAESEEISKDIIVDYDEGGNLVRIEVLWVSRKADIN